MKRALILGSSGGIGAAVMETLSVRGVDVTGRSRRSHGLDVTCEHSVETVLSDLDGPYDVIFVTTGALVVNGAQPEKAISQTNHNALCEQFAVNAAGPMLLLKHCVRLLPRKEPAVFAALSARVGSIGDNRLGGWYAYRSAKAALNQLMHGAAIELSRSHPQLCVACLHPGTVATPFTAGYRSRFPTISPQDAASRLADVLSSLTAEDTGRFFDNEKREIPW